MKKTLLLLLMVFVAISCLLTSCNSDEEKTVESIEVDTSTIETEYTINSITDFSDIKVTVKYSDGSTETVGEDKLTLGDVDTSTVGVKELSVTYEGITVKVNITVVDEDTSNAVIKGVALPNSVTSIESAKPNFKDQTQKNYVVGDDNPYVLTLVLQVYDKETNQPITTYTSYTGVSKVYLVEGETETLLEGASIATYVAIDEVAHTYDFTDAAVGKVFKIETRPSKDYINVESVTETLTVEVVDAYNIYDAKELNFLTNDVTFKYGRDNDLVQVDIVNAFLAANGLTRPASYNGFVLHKDIVLTLEDIPAEYIVPASAGEGAAGFIYDYLMIYNHVVTKENPTFNFYGNYHTIDSKNLPRVPEDDDGAYNGDGISNSALFFFGVEETVIKSCVKDAHGNLIANYPYTDDMYDYLTYDPADYVTNLYDIVIRDNDPTSNNHDISKVANRGLLGMKANLHTVNLDNVRMEAFMLSILLEGDHQEVNLNNVILNNAWQNHIFAWSKNILWQRNEAENNQPDKDTYHKLVININNSEITKCGGPVIISQTAGLEYLGSSYSGNIINIDDKTEIGSYISTADAWFEAYPTAAYYADMIVAANDVIKGMSQNTAGFVDTTMYEGSDIMNIVMIDMLAGTDLSFDPTKDLKSILTVNGKELLNQDEIPTAAAMLIAQTGGQLPIFVTSDGGVFGINPQATTPAEALIFIGDSIAPECLSGDYITLYWLGMAITFEYFHFAPAA